ncbi:DUF2798 domain-containing protein [Marinobacter sp. SS21]|uniref:DUF2798 domain-containing protein n=1 Tax=Marinobacter sp. SS21 TaxID=2979460 RepID=UPI00232CB4C3|nr:DUF2798 domain-containing protein [Marinobacter sp. SS21]MDC0661152.1 DUF2798 domain-containing protein [Marinobacter sp. SS21]
MTNSVNHHRKLRHLVFAFYMSGLMSLCMSAVVTFVNTGMDTGFPARWMGAFLIAWAVAFPLVSLVSPLAHRLTGLTLDRGLPKPPE